MSMEHTPYVPEDTKLKELTLRAVLLGIFLAIILGAANAYLALKAGMTISAMFPAAVIAIAIFRLPFIKGSVLEQNITRTAASVGEALVAGAVFTVPAFLLVNVGGERLWTSFNYWETSLVLLIGGVMGVLFIIFLRRTLTVDAGLPFPESAACFEITKAGQKGASGAGYVFGAMGIGALIELLKNGGGFTIFKECKEFFIKFPVSIIQHFNTSKEPIGKVAHEGGISITTPLASSALMGVGYIIGPKYAAINFAGGVLAWLVLIPLALFLNPNLASQLTVEGVLPGTGDLVYSIWYNQIRPIAVGAMLLGAVYTLWGLRKSLSTAFSGVFGKSARRLASPSRLEKDMNLKWTFSSIVLLTIPLAFVYYYFTASVGGAIMAAIVMLISGFLLSAIGGWLVGLIGGSNQPVSGLTLSALVVAALLMLTIKLTGLAGVAAVLGVASVVCCAICISGDMIQDLKVGHLLGGTPWKMELAEMLSVIVVSFFLVFPMIILHEGNIAAGGLGIGDTKLPAPQAGLMAQLATGIVGGQTPWGLIIMGMGLTLMLIMIRAPSPMLIAVGMYLPFETTFAIFVGGVIKWIADSLANFKKFSEPEKGKAYNTGTLIASGFIAGEAITGVILASLVLAGIPSLTQYFTGKEALGILEQAGGWLSLIIFAVVGYALVKIPLARK